MYGAILEKGQKYYTNLKIIFDKLENIENYNWLITDWECNQDVRELKDNYCWLTGLEFEAILSKYNDLQWIWGVITGFDKTIKLDDILKFNLPKAENESFWHNPISIQHPLAGIEIVAWDSSLVLVISKNKSEIDKFKHSFNLSEDLEQYNIKNEASKN